MNNGMHETKIHGKFTFPYIVYRGNIPEYISSYPLHWHDEMEIIYNLNGIGKILVQDKEYILNKNDIVIIPPQTVHAVQQFENKHMEYFNILFKLSLLVNTSDDYCYDKYLSPYYKCAKKFPTYIDAGSELNDILSPYVTALIENRKKSYSGYELMIKSHLFAILHYIGLYSNPMDKNDAFIQNTYEKIKLCLQYISENYQHQINIKEMALLCGFSESYFMKLFKSLTGTSFTQYLKNYRLEISAEQISKTSDKIINIAANCGFPNQSYFIRTFMAKYKMSPSTYRNVYKVTNI